MKNKTIFMQGDRMHLHVGNHPNGSTCSVRLCKCIQSSLLKVFFIIWAFHFLFLEEVVNLSKADMSHCQMLGKVEYGLPAKIWRLVGCTEMLSWVKWCSHIGQQMPCWQKVATGPFWPCFACPKLGDAGKTRVASKNRAVFRKIIRPQFWS